MSEDAQEIKDLHIENQSVCHIGIFYFILRRVEIKLLVLLVWRKMTKRERRQKCEKTGETSMRIGIPSLFHFVYSY